MIISSLNALSEIAVNFGFAPFAPILQPIVQGCLEEHGKNKCRKGTILTPSLLAWLCIALALRLDLNYNKALNWVIAGVRWKTLNLPAKIVKDGAVSHARAKMGVAVFRDIFTKFVASFKKVPPDFHGFISVVFDGTSMTMPNTESNRKKFGKHKAGERIRSISPTASGCIDDRVRSMHHRHRIRSLQRQKDGRKNVDVRNSEKMPSNKLPVPFRRGFLLLFFSIPYVRNRTKLHHEGCQIGQTQTDSRISDARWKLFKHSQRQNR